MNVEESLKFMRKRRGLSQEQLAPKLHMSRVNLSKIERGLVSIRTEDYFRWAKVTNSQDVLIAIACNIDLTIAADLISNVTDTMHSLGAIIMTIGGIL
ncbi:Helix-turn-helix [Oceanobacillus oncorhynchi]|uniref:Helix-turn-helix n=1 Tax=Oceanobacillus oncorhynchi TaxID=545501 RepID=A0A0A1MNM9_9BACI|nr:helix-turn-helix transcriptional regulator [Oceanobacillus oncorhynchi]CEI81257.1 Helix-turn-helix [Oceanobacillus oncorhynchi]